MNLMWNGSKAMIDEKQQEKFESEIDRVIDLLPDTMTAKEKHEAAVWWVGE